MKKLVKALSGKKAMYAVLAATVIATVLELVTAARLGAGYKVDWMAMGVMYCMITVWAAALETAKKKTEAAEA